MPTRNVNLTDELDGFIASKVASGKYENASEVVRAGLRVLHEQDEARTQWLGYLRGEATRRFAALDRGEGITTTVDELLTGIDEELKPNR